MMEVHLRFYLQTAYHKILEIFLDVLQLKLNEKFIRYRCMYDLHCKCICHA